MAKPQTPISIQRSLAKTRIGRDLVSHLEETESKKAEARQKVFPVIIEFNREFPGGAIGARDCLRVVLLGNQPCDQANPQVVFSPDRSRLRAIFASPASTDFRKSEWTDSYLFAKLTRKGISVLANVKCDGVPLVYKIWRDQQIERCVYESVRTIKHRHRLLRAARASFGR